MTKTCSKCRFEKPIEDFHINRKSKDGKQHRCKECSKELTQAATKVWRTNNPTAASASNIRTKIKLKYGLTLEEITKLLDTQNGCCAICDEPISFIANDKRSKPHVDHDHETGIVRGLLCLTCNTGLGMFRDSKNLLEQASVYLSNAGQRDRLSELAPLTEGDAIVGTYRN